VKKLLALLAVSSLIAGTGCATMWAMPLTGAAIPYVGTIVDVAGIGNARNDAGLAALALADLPFSFALDTALLPVTGARALADARY
jgi:uncharacterized protein YceK